MTITAETKLSSLGDNTDVKSVLAQFGVIHCTSCDIPDKTVAEIAADKKLPAEMILNAINAKLA
ncbi:MAG: hypothetical protein V3V10_03170 [Planctomycetota bacterium]